MKRITFGLLFLFTCIVCPSASGQEAETRRWKDEAELALVNTTGNSEILTFAFKNALNYKFTPHITGGWEIGALKGENDGETTAERYYTDLRLDYIVTNQFYTFLLGGWLKDHFAGLDQRYNIGPGIGYKFLSGPKNVLRCEAGLNYTYEDYVTAEEQAFMEGRAFGSYEYAFSSKNRFLFNVEYLQAFNESQNFKVNAEAAVVANLIEALSLKIGYGVRYQNRPLPADLEKTDTILSASFIVTF